MASAAKPGTASTQQISRIRRRAEQREISYPWLMAIAGNERNKTRRRWEETNAVLPSRLEELEGLSMFEASDVIKILEAEARPPVICTRCVRLGFVFEGPSCVHSGASEESRRVAEFERRRGMAL